MLQRKIQVSAYNPLWPEQFKTEEAQIKKALQKNCLAIHHVGSTSVPGLAAKPKIDIIVVVKNPIEAIEKLQAIGFDYRGEYNIPFHYGFSKRSEVSVNLHVYEEGNPEIELNLAFRDYLRSHPEIRDEYAAIKMGLLKENSSFEKKNSLFSGYNLGKDAFIRKLLKLAGFERLRFVICTHYDEWDAAKKLRQKYFFKTNSDPYEWTFNHQDHIHFILYQGVDIVGYAHIQLWPKSRAALRIIVVEEAKRKQGFGSQFLKWIETYLKSKSYDTLHTQASPDSVQFYEHLGYAAMPFNDPDGYEEDLRDTPLGKNLP